MRQTIPEELMREFLSPVSGEEYVVPDRTPEEWARWRDYVQVPEDWKNKVHLYSRHPPVDVIWSPLRGAQTRFLRCSVFEVLFHGTRGGGKTDCLVMDFLKEVGQGHGAAWKGILFRQTYPQLQDVIAKTKKWFPQITPNAVYNNSAHFWRWPDGEILLLRQFKRDDDYWNFHGHEYPWIGWEELCNWPSPAGFKRMMSCCRSSDPNVPRKVRSTANPYGPGHNWVKHRYKLPGHDLVVIRDEKDEEGNVEPPRVAIPSTLRENTVLLKADPEYISRLRASARNEAELKAWLEGDWDIVAGGMFDDVWDRKFNIVQPFAIPSSWRIDRSFDWGSSAPFSVGWWAESDGTEYVDADGRRRSTVRGDLFRVAEWYGWNKKPNEGLRMTALEIAKGIVLREIRMGWRSARGSDRPRVRPGPADSSIYDAENGVCIATDMEQSVRFPDGTTHVGILWERADKSPGSRKTGWQDVRQMMKSARPDQPGLPRERPGLFVFSTCDQFVRTVPVLPRDEDDLDDVDSDSEDHIGDEVRYRVRFSKTRPPSQRAVGL